MPARSERSQAEVFDGVFDAAYRVATERFAPFAAACDIAEPRIVDGRAWTIPETRAALAAYIEALVNTYQARVEIERATASPNLVKR